MQIKSVHSKAPQSETEKYGSGPPELTGIVTLQLFLEHSRSCKCTYKGKQALSKEVVCVHFFFFIGGVIVPRNPTSIDILIKRPQKMLPLPNCTAEMSLLTQTSDVVSRGAGGNVLTHRSLPGVAGDVGCTTVVLLSLQLIAVLALEGSVECFVSL